MIIKYYIPLLYALSTRFAHRSKKGVVQWIVDYWFPLTMLFLVSSTKRDVLLLGISIVAIISVYNLYEIGYIQNDADTVKGEVKPTMRLCDSDLAYYERNKFNIYGFRLVQGIFCSCFFCIIHSNKSGFLVILALMWLILPLYHVYNNNRKKWCIVLLNILTTYRYVMPLLLVWGSFDSFSIAIAYFMYPFPTIIQQIVMGKFGVDLPWIKRYVISDFKKRYFFRVKFYSIFFLFVLISVLTMNKTLLYLLLPLYYFVIRLAMWMRFPGEIEDHR